MESKPERATFQRLLEVFLTMGIEVVLRENILDSTQEVIQKVASALPQRFPDHVATSIFQGLESMVMKLN